MLSCRYVYVNNDLFTGRPENFNCLRSKPHLTGSKEGQLLKTASFMVFGGWRYFENLMLQKLF